MSFNKRIILVGNSETCKDIIEAIDDENKTITIKKLDGDLLKYYKTMKVKVQAIGPSEGGSSSVKWTLEYEKHNDDIPDPIKYIDFLPVSTKSIDAYLVRNAKLSTT